jgi:protocatechuate 3,4-dioxygenase beta subunit
MEPISRRFFFKQGATSLAALGATGLVLRAEARPTEPLGDLGDFERFAAGAQIPPLPASLPPTPTTDNDLGPYYRPGAPFRAKITPPAEPGTLLVIRGRVWGYDTKKPLAGAVLDIWQANDHGHYDFEGRLSDAPKELFKYRARVRADETGFYEYETIHPGYYTGRTRHIHYLVQHPGYQKLVTQLYFKDDPRNKTDSLFRESLAIDLAIQKFGDTPVELGHFDIVLAPAATARV